MKTCLACGGSILILFKKLHVNVTFVFFFFYLDLLGLIPPGPHINLLFILLLFALWLFGFSINIFSVKLFFTAAC
jgi:hypothetical protein